MHRCRFCGIYPAWCVLCFLRSVALVCDTDYGEFSVTTVQSFCSFSSRSPVMCVSHPLLSHSPCMFSCVFLCFFGLKDSIRIWSAWFFGASCLLTRRSHVPFFPVGVYLCVVLTFRLFAGFSCTWPALSTSVLSILIVIFSPWWGSSRISIGSPGAFSLDILGTWQNSWT